MLNEAALEQDTLIQGIPKPNYDIAGIMGGLYGPGIIGLKSGFRKEWIQELHKDILHLYEEALKRPGGAVGRGPKRHYVEIHPKDIHGFIDLVTHPWVQTVCEKRELGPEYKIVEIGFDRSKSRCDDPTWYRHFSCT